MPSTLNLSVLGRRVRATRLARRLTLEEVVSRSGFTVSWLSKVENGQLAPSLEGLVTLAAALECGVETLVEGLSVPPRYVVVRRGEGLAGEGRGSNVVESLAGQWRSRHMNPSILHVKPPGSASHPDNHDGERFLLVLEGRVVVTYGDERITLDTGDSVYIFAAIPHSIAPAAGGTARLLSVSYEPPGGGSTGPDGRPISRRPAAKGSRGRAAKTRGRASDQT